MFISICDPRNVTIGVEWGSRSYSEVARFYRLTVVIHNLVSACYIDGWIDKWMDRGTEGRMDRQTNSNLP